MICITLTKIMATMWLLLGLFIPDAVSFKMSMLLPSGRNVRRRQVFSHFKSVVESIDGVTFRSLEVPRSTSVTTATSRESVASTRSPAQMLYEKVFLTDLQTKKSPWKFDLLHIDELEDATDIVVDSHYKSPMKSVQALASRNKFLSSLTTPVDDHHRAVLRKKIIDGFYARSYRRLHSPSLTLNHESLILVAHEKSTNILVGVVEIYPTQPETYLCNLAVDRGYRRRGLAKALCVYAERVSKHAWLRPVIALQVRRSNHAAVQLYERLGYTAGEWEKRQPSFASIMMGEGHLVTYRKQLQKDTQSSSSSSLSSSVLP
mmetsp:Transcript_22291/g.37291  ORF Transcript_22291/g.37291 Transcript_22291/m.37291 type:complete len:318 (+) Transcript_22291:95-1048(+)